MMARRTTLSPTVRRRVAEEARHRCGYCLVSEELLGMAMSLDHLVPVAQGGGNEPENLWLACRRCNEYKADQIQAADPQTGEIAALFNPRRQSWDEHFAWSSDGAHIIGKTACGRASVAALRLNRVEMVTARRLWVSVGWWPPLE